MSAPGIFHLPPPQNEPVREYAPGSPERAELQAKLAELQSERMELPLVIGGEEIRTGETAEVVMPHRTSHVLADMHQGGPARSTRRSRPPVTPGTTGREPPGRNARPSSCGPWSSSPARGA